MNRKKISLKRQKQIILQVMDRVSASKTMGICNAIFLSCNGKEGASFLKQHDCHCMIDFFFGNVISVELYKPKQLVEINGIEYWYDFNLVGQSKRETFLNKILYNINNEILEQLNRQSNI